MAANANDARVCGLRLCAGSCDLLDLAGVPANKKSIDELIAIYEQEGVAGAPADNTKYDAFVYCSILKRWLRNLRSPGQARQQADKGSYPSRNLI